MGFKGTCHFKYTRKKILFAAESLLNNLNVNPFRLSVKFEAEAIFLLNFDFLLLLFLVK